RYRGVYRGIDLVYYGRQGQLEYDFIVAPGAEARAIGLEIVGAEGVGRWPLRIDPKGDLVIATDGGDVRFHQPKAYQTEGGLRRPVGARYVLRGKGAVGLEVAAYDRRRPLIIDPVLSYSTYLGGTGGDVAYGIAVDASKYAYITGITNSSNFPILGGAQPSNSGSGDAFVVKLNTTGNALVYSTYLGGSGADTAFGIAVAAGDAYVTGKTTSADFPTTSVLHGAPVDAFQLTYGGGDSDAFITHLNSSGNALVYSSYLGGRAADQANAIAVDSSGNAYLTGATQSPDFPLVNALQPTNGGGSDVFVTKVNFSGTALVYSTYLGGAQADTGQAIKVDSSGNAYVTGYTFSSDFPTQNPYQGSTTGPPDAFVAELNPDGSALVFSTYLGGSGDDRGLGIALDTSGGVYITGYTYSTTDFPTTVAAFQSVNRGDRDAFISKLSPAGSNLVYSTLLGGAGADQANGIAVDSSGNAFVTGFTQSSDFPTYTPVQAVLGISGGSFCGANPCADAFVTQINSSGGALNYSTYLGGSGPDYGQAIALASSGVPYVYVTGLTVSDNFPAIAGAYQASLAGVAGNTFVAMIDPASGPGIAIVPASVNFGNQPLSVRSAAKTVTVINAGSASLTINGITTSGDFLETGDCNGVTLSGGGGYCTISITFTPLALGAVTEEISLTDTAPNSPHTITVTGTGVAASTAVTVSPTSLSFGDVKVGSVSAPKTVTITNTGTSTLNISNISASPLGGDFVQTNTCGATLNVLDVGESCTASVSFQPLGSGSRSGSLIISSNASGSPHAVALSGTGDAVFSLTSASPTTTVTAGSTSATFSVSASAPPDFAGNITLSCSSGLTCAFDPATIFPGQTSTLTLSNLTASTTNPLNFTVSGTSGSQTATLSLTLLLADFSLSVSPALHTITAGQPAEYTVLVTPSHGFGQAVTLSCENLPSQSGCRFSQSSVTPNGSPASVTLTVTTVKNSSLLYNRRTPFGGSRLPFVLWLMLFGPLWFLFRVWKRERTGSATVLRSLLLSWRLAGISLALALLLGMSSCRGVGGVGGTPTGNYTITVRGILNSNTDVQRTTTFNLAVT
ncbi:MAG: SBBP repeat-containing protein, partial [Terriglobia bacterium]